MLNFLNEIFHHTFLAMSIVSFRDVTSVKPRQAYQLPVFILISLKMIMDSSKYGRLIIPFKKFGMLSVYILSLQLIQKIAIPLAVVVLICIIGSEGNEGYQNDFDKVLDFKCSKDNEVSFNVIFLLVHLTYFSC